MTCHSVSLRPLPYTCSTGGPDVHAMQSETASLSMAPSLPWRPVWLMWPQPDRCIPSNSLAAWFIRGWRRHRPQEWQDRRRIRSPFTLHVGALPCCLLVCRANKPKLLPQLSEASVALNVKYRHPDGLLRFVSSAFLAARLYESIVQPLVAGPQVASQSNKYDAIGR